MSTANKYTDDDKQRFTDYVARQLAKIDDVENKDDDFLTECILTMYANPVVNQMTAL